VGTGHWRGDPSFQEFFHKKKGGEKKLDPHCSEGPRKSGTKRGPLRDKKRKKIIGVSTFAKKQTREGPAVVETQNIAVTEKKENFKNSTAIHDHTSRQIQSGKGNEKGLRKALGKGKCKQSKILWLPRLLEYDATFPPRLGSALGRAKILDCDFTSFYAGFKRAQLLLQRP